MKVLLNPTDLGLVLVPSLPLCYLEQLDLSKFPSIIKMGLIEVDTSKVVHSPHTYCLSAYIVPGLRPWVCSGGQRISPHVRTQHGIYGLAAKTVIEQLAQPSRPGCRTLSCSGPPQTQQLLGCYSTVRWGISCCHQSKGARDKLFFFSCKNRELNSRRGNLTCLRPLTPWISLS